MTTAYQQIMVPPSVVDAGHDLVSTIRLGTAWYDYAKKGDTLELVTPACTATNHVAYAEVVDVYVMKFCYITEGEVKRNDALEHREYFALVKAMKEMYNGRQPTFSTDAMCTVIVYRRISKEDPYFYPTPVIIGSNPELSPNAAPPTINNVRCICTWVDGAYTFIEWDPHCPVHRSLQG